MECNKDEAVRARDLAEKKMLSKDFIGAKKFSVKAQQLFPDIDGISQMLTVCEVHCASEVKINGLDDWYGILQVPSTADESLIKKQYRKFAFLLHPDKNKYFGAEEAFKLVGEANRILTDQSKRSLYDLKRSTSSGVVKPKPPPKPANTTSFPNGQNGPHMRSNFRNVNFSGLNHEQQQPQTQTAPTFWTSCPFCRIRYQYYRTIMNRSLRCQNCLKPFVAYDLSSQSVPGGPTSGYPCNKEFSGQNTCNNMHQSNQNNVGGGSTAGQNVGVKNDLDGKFSNSKKDGRGCSTGGKMDDITYEKVKLEEMNRRGSHGAKTSGSPNKKRNRRVAESTDSEGLKDGFSFGKNVSDHISDRRTSNRHGDSANVDEDAVGALKRSRKGKFSTDEQVDDFANKGGKGAGIGEHKDGLHNGNDEGGNIKSSGVGTSSKDDADVGAAVPGICHYPDPEFYEFEQIRSANSFEVGQVWAIYDDLDGMPRFYGRIRNVAVTPSFKVRFSWLEHDANNQHEIDWSDKELPVGTGSFKLGSSQTSEDLPMFSHLMQWDKGARKHSYVIRPRRGEIWALFEGWDIKWAYEPEIRKSYKYEIVEILFGDTEPVISVMPLVKVKGSVSVFARPVNTPAILNIQPDEKLRFSHMIPSHILTGSEREGIPVGSFELDPASLPADVEKLYPSVSYMRSKIETEAENKETKTNTSSLNLGAGVKPCDHGRKSNDKRDWCNAHETGSLGGWQDPVANAGKTSRDETDQTKCHEKEIPFQKSDDMKDSSLPSRLDGLVFEYPEPEFHDFSLAKSLNKVRVGQIWALYSDVDGYPKYYGIIKDVDAKDSKVHLTWLEGHPLLEDEVKWTDRLPLSCGQFKISCAKNESEVYDSLDAFSHLVPAKPLEKKHCYEIYPCVGEIWALYRNFSADWDESNLGNCEHDVVEITKVADYSIEVSFLVKVKGYNCVFEPKRVNGVIQNEEIHRARLLQFSHYIPAFRLTEERGGKLRGFWELDPAAVPELILCS